MTKLAKESQSGDLKSLHAEPQYTGLISREALIRRLSRGGTARIRFVESNLDKAIAYQIRSLRDREKWTQSEFAEKLGIKYQNNVSARLENPNYGKHTLTTLKKIAAACDVGLVVWFIPFSRLIDWATATPHLDSGLSPNFYDIPAFANDAGLRETPSAEYQPIAAAEAAGRPVSSMLSELFDTPAPQRSAATEFRIRRDSDKKQPGEQHTNPYELAAGGGRLGLMRNLAG